MICWNSILKMGISELVGQSNRMNECNSGGNIFGKRNVSMDLAFGQNGIKM